MIVVHKRHRVHLPKQNDGTKRWLTNKMQIQPYKLSDRHPKNASRTGRSEVSALLVEGRRHSLSLLCRRVWTWNLPGVLSKLFGLVFHFVLFVYKFISRLMWTYLIWTFCTFMLFIRHSWALKSRLDISWDFSSPSDAFQRHIFVNISLHVQKPHLAGWSAWTSGNSQPLKLIIPKPVISVLRGHKDDFGFGDGWRCFTWENYGFLVESCVWLLFFLHDRIFRQLYIAGMIHHLMAWCQKVNMVGLVVVVGGELFIR